MALLENKKAYANYEILQKFEAGIKLLGLEVKSLKLKRGNISGSRVIIRGGEAFIVGMEVPAYQPKNAPKDYDIARTRKLLIHKNEIDYLTGKTGEKGLTIIPLSVYTKGNIIKISFGLARGLKKYDKREKIKERETKREIERKMKHF